MLKLVWSSNEHLFSRLLSNNEEIRVLKTHEQLIIVGWKQTQDLSVVGWLVDLQAHLYGLFSGPNQVQNNSLGQKLIRPQSYEKCKNL